MKLLQHILILAVRLYRGVLSPAKTFILGPLARCRFEPSCSEYALQALQRHGANKGSRLALKRLCRCHPWGSWGPDPVPPTALFEKRQRTATLPSLQPAPSPRISARHNV